MASGVQYQKKSVSLPKDVIEWVEESVEPGGFSAFVTEALRWQSARSVIPK